MDKSENKEKNTNMSGYVMQGSLETGEISNVSFLIIERETWLLIDVRVSSDKQSWINCTYNLINGSN